MARKQHTEPEPPKHEAPAVEVAPVPEKKGLELFLFRYLADQKTSPGELAPLQWRRPQSEQATVSSKFGTLVWPDGSPAVFPTAEAATIAAYLRPIRPNDQINIQPV